VRFGIDNSAWRDTPDPAEAFEAVKVKAQWSENHGLVWFSVMDHMIHVMPYFVGRSVARPTGFRDAIRELPHRRTWRRLPC
jgi:hypothetical protein